jgi:hypothetical protein
MFIAYVGCKLRTTRQREALTTKTAQNDEFIGNSGCNDDDHNDDQPPSQPRCRSGSRRAGARDSTSLEPRYVFCFVFLNLLLIYCYLASKNSDHHPKWARDASKCVSSSNNLNYGERHPEQHQTTPHRYQEGRRQGSRTSSRGCSGVRTSGGRAAGTGLENARSRAPVNISF